MDLTVFRQAQKVRADGRTIYKGEDTLPFVNEHILLVADGLGGASAIRHQSFNKDMFDSEKLFDVLFNNVFEDADEDIRQYVVRSYYEFLSIADCYFDNINNIKKSGYFGSRIVSAIFLYLAKKFMAEWETKYYTEFSSITDEHDRKIWLDNIGEQFTLQLKSMLLKVSEKYSHSP